MDHMAIIVCLFIYLASRRTVNMTSGIAAKQTKANFHVYINATIIPIIKVEKHWRSPLKG